MAELWVARVPGRVPYLEAVELQTRLRERRQAGEIPDSLLLLEHPPTYTKGRRSEKADLPMGEEWYWSQGIEVHGTSRGGRVTYHGPGQLVGYPIMGVTDVVAFLRTMESAIITALADEGVAAEVREGLTGVWVGDRKIGSIGLHVSRGVTMHGFAVNVDGDLQPFEWIVPCGIDGVRMTSLYLATGLSGGMDCFRKRVAWRFTEAFGLRQRIVTLDRLLGSQAPVESIPA
ncbi:MAG: lipoyl(octanoyl) transferase [Thermoleophilaceae bacterium]|nr:lipoyl(octanoyl) transferase [Thermoleophilaceae bacterium]